MTRAPKVGDWALSGLRLVKLRSRADIVAHLLVGSLVVLGSRPRAYRCYTGRYWLEWPGGLTFLPMFRGGGARGWYVREWSGHRPNGLIENPRSADALWSYWWHRDPSTEGAERRG